MSPFLIFATVLTFIYFVYFGITIIRDLYSKPSEQTDMVENFDVSDMEQEEESIVVTDEYVLPTHQQVILDPPSVHETGTSIDENNSSDTMSNEEINEIGNEGTEPVIPEVEFSLDSSEYMDYLEEQHNNRKIKTEAVNETI